MRTRITIVVALMVLASTLWAGVGQLTPAEAALRTQVGMLQVAIHPGTCANTAPTPVLLLNNFASSDQSGDAAAPLFSYTAAPMALVDLLAAPRAIVATLGGDTDATIACGNLGEITSEGQLSVVLQEENDSGFAGVALLTDAGETAHISVVLAETPPALPGTTSSRSPGTPAPGATAPVGTQESAPATPVLDETPIGIPIPALTPEAPTPVTGTPETAEVPASPYTSAMFGYSIAFSPPWQVVYGPEIKPDTDLIVLSNGTSVVSFLGLAGVQSAPECLDRLYERVVLARPGLRLVVPHEGRDSGATVSTPEQAIEVWDITSVNDAGQSITQTYYANCLVLQPGQSALLLTHEAPRDDYSAQAALRDQLYAGVTLGQAAATRADMPEAAATREGDGAAAVTTLDDTLGAGNVAVRRSSDASAILLMIHNCPPGTALAEIQVTPCPRAATGFEPVLTGVEGTWTGADLVAEQAGPVWHDVPHGEYVLTFEALPGGHDMFYVYGEGTPPTTDVLGGEGIAVTLGPETVTPQDFLPLTVYFVDVES